MNGKAVQDFSGERPNILFVFSDMHCGLDWSGSRWHPDVWTPNLARFASQGVTLERCRVNTPICLPYRVQMHTGRHIRDGRTLFNAPGERMDSQPSWPAALAAAGYRTAYVGKWHIPPIFHGPISPAQRLGYRDYWRKSDGEGSVEGATYYREDTGDQRHLRDGHEIAVTGALSRIEVELPTCNRVN